MGEIGEAVEILNIAFDGVDVVFKVCGAGVKGIKTLASVFQFLFMRDKLEGKVTMKQLLQQGSDLQVFKFDESQIKTFEKYAKKYGILYTRLPDINKEDKMTEVLFHTDSLPRVIALQEKMKVGQVTSLEEYISNGKEEEIEKLLNEPGEEKNLKSLAEQLSPEKMEELGKVKEQLDVAELSKDESKICITIDEKLVYNEDEKNVRTRIPRQPNEFIEFKAEDVKVINNGKTRLTFLDKDKEYDILDKAGKPVKKMTGKAIYDRSYDPVFKDTLERTARADKAKKALKNKPQSTSLKEHKRSGR